MAINILDSFIINRISAGEVVESPFSIVKELIDNSIDAKATKITIEIKNGGIDQIIIKDNGCGIDYDDIKKAFLPHATSKISSIDDLEEIYTLGFRGEALASISNVSQTTITTRVMNNDNAYTLDVFGGHFGEIVPTSSDVGTKIEVNNVFYNTPARRKFLKKPKQEESQITNIVARFILSNPNISFKYVVDNKIVYQTTGNGSLLDTIYTIYGKEFTQNLVYVEREFDNIKLSGFVSKIGYSKPNTTYQTLILNNRYVIDETVSKAAYMAFEEYLMPRQFPAYVFNIKMPAIDVDVNVHPSKINIKFVHPNRIYDLVYTSIWAAIYKQISPQSQDSSVQLTESPLIKTDINALKEIEIQPNFTENINKNLVFKQESYSPITFFDMQKTTMSYAENDNLSQITSTNKSPTEEALNKENITIGTKQDDYINIESLSNFKIIGQLFNEFIVLEKDSNMLLLDFHAGHERLNYDMLSEMVKNREVVIQNLLIPYTHSLTAPEITYILSLQNELSELGFEVDMFGDNQIIINAIPMQLKDINLKTFIDDILHDMKNLKPSLNDEIKRYLMQKACKSSVKAGKALSEMEIQQLLKNLDIKHPVLLCPHGRPVVTVVSKSQIEKWFKRIV